MILNNLAFGWLWILAGFASGGTIGLFFRKPEFLGGYDALPRRLVRLGHISFYGLGSINIMYGLSMPALFMVPTWIVSTNTLMAHASWAFVIGAISMPTACFLTAWREKLHHTFYLPVASLLYAGWIVVWLAFQVRMT